MKKEITMRNLTSKKNVIAALLIASLSTMPAIASAENLEKIMQLSAQEKHEQQEDNINIGFGSGLVVGAIVAGPIGAFVAGLTGTFIAKHLNATTEVEELTQSLAQVQIDHQQYVAQFQNKLQDVEQSYQTQLASLEDKQQLADQLQAENLLMSLQFSTGSSDIAAHYQEQISALAQILNNSPMMKIDLSGYTDLEGEQELNQNLSLARVQSVKTLLMAQGVNEQQIATFAFGEGAPVVATNEHEVSFYDRRVVLKLHNPFSQTAQR